MDQTTNAFAYRCLPLTMANMMGWVIECPVTFTARWNGGKSHRDSIEFCFHDDNFNWPGIVMSHFGNGVITFQLPWLFRTNGRVGLLARGEPNTYKWNCHALEGYVETWWLTFTFTMNWKIVQPGLPVVFERGDPICFIQPYGIDILDGVRVREENMSVDPQLTKDFQAWSDSRKAFNADRERRPEDWQKRYHKGLPRDGCPTPMPGHRATVRLPHFLKETRT
jgi:hypothetical protein